MSRLPLLGIGVFSLIAAPQTISPDYDQPYRPQFHFSPREHWTNDPNGLVYFKDEYHLFFQYNPFGDQSDHKSWGHAVSKDLVHWQQLPVALPEENGVMIFTGSVVIDRENSSGFCDQDQPCLVAIYTGHMPASGQRKQIQTQNLAYSKDRGRTWTTYPGNPVLDLNLSDFRDPHVFWSDQSRKWVMAVSLPNDHKVRFYGSLDLKHWSTMSEFGPAGATGGQWECPDLFELPVDGRDETRWVLKVGLNPGGRAGGSGEQYFIGRFDGMQFINDYPASLMLWTDDGKDCYCALTFNGLPSDQNPIMIGWMDNWQYASKLPTSPWRGQMTFPKRLSLRTTAEGIRLFQSPVDQLQLLLGAHVQVESDNIRHVNTKLNHSDVVTGHSFEVRSAIPLGASQEVGWKLLNSGGTYTLVGFDRQKSVVYVDRTHSGRTDFSKDFPARMEAPLHFMGSILRLDILVDRSSVEVFAADGQVTMTNLVFPPPEAGGIELYAKGGSPGRVSAAIWRVQSTHTQGEAGKE